MIPKNDSSLISLKIETQPSKSYALDTATGRIRGFADGLDALMQAIYLILNVERYRCLIYSWDYGTELQSLIGQPVSFVLPEIKRLITEALTQDDRIESVDNFTFKTSRSIVHVTFTVHTLLGDIDTETEVTI